MVLIELLSVILMCVQSNAADLFVLWEKMCQEVKDRTSRRHLDKFGALLKKIKPDYTSPGTYMTQKVYNSYNYYVSFCVTLPPFQSLEPAAVAEEAANSPVAKTTAVSAQKGQESTVKPKRTRGKSTGAKPRGEATL